MDFTGAPYYAGMAALRVGAELLYVLTAKEAAGAIKTYSPELMVSPVYADAKMQDPQLQAGEQRRMVDAVINVLPRLHALCIGPGLGRSELVLGAVAQIIEAARDRDLPLVLDADALWLINQRPGLVIGYRRAVLTPNAIEFGRLRQAVLGDESSADAAAQPDGGLEALCEALEGAVVLQKGAVDRAVAAGKDHHVVVDEAGAPRRPGGLGDLLCGTLSIVLAWSAQSDGCSLEACRAASLLVRRACRAAYQRHRRAMVAPDVLGELGPCFEELCPADAGEA